MAPEHVDLLKAGFDGEDIAAQFHVAGHTLVVNVITQVVRNVRLVLGHFFREVGRCSVFAKVTFLKGALCIIQIAAVVAGDFRAELAVLGDELRFASNRVESD